MQSGSTWLVLQNNKTPLDESYFIDQINKVFKNI